MEDKAHSDKIYAAGYAGTIGGKGREISEEFSLFFEKEPEGTVGASNLYILTSGIIGTFHPEVCARFAAKKILFEFFQSYDYVDANKLALAIRTTNNEIFEYAKVQSEKMGASVLTAAVTDGKIVIGNVGANHAYIIRNGKVFQITEDQDVIAEKVQSGEVTAEEAYGSGESEHQNPAIGFEKDIVIDIYDGIEVKNGDILLLCSHTMDTFIGKKEILEAAFETTSKGIVESLLDIPSANGIEQGASVVAIRIYDSEGIQSIIRNEGSEPCDTDLNSETKDVSLIQQARPHKRQNQTGTKRNDKLPKLIIGGILLVLLAAAAVWISTAGNLLERIVGPKNTPTATIDAVQASLAVFQMTVEADQATSVAATLQAWPTQTPLPSPTAEYFNLDVSTPEVIITGSPEDSNGLINGATGAEIVVETSVVPTEVPVKENIINDIDGADMVYVPAGNFLLGSDITSDGYANTNEESPQQEVFLSAYWIGKNEVTNSQYQACVDAGVCEFGAYMLLNNPYYAEHPVTYVTEPQAETYCGWIGGRLPTEFEWEKAARGTDGRIYPWGNEEPTLENHLANIPYYVDEATSQSNDLFTVGDFPEGVSPYGALDMAGNAWEWTSTWYSSSTYQALEAETETNGQTVANPTGPESGSTYVIRGGSSSTTEVNNYLVYLRTANRGYINMSSSYFVGFRCVLEDR